MMVELTNRELASIILFVVFVGAFVLVPSLRSQVGSSFASVLQSFLVWRIQLIPAMYFVYTFSIIIAASELGFWTNLLLKETLIAVCFVGIPILFSASKVKQGAKLVHDVVRGVLGVAALVGAYTNLVSIPLWGELLLQPLLFLLTGLALVARNKPEHRTVERLANSLLGIIGIGLLVYATRVIVSNWTAEMISLEAAKLALSVWLPVALIPFVYVLAFVMHSEIILTMLPFFKEGRKPSMGVRFACLWGLHFSARFAAEFNGQWRGRVARVTGFREAPKVMDEFREAVRERDRALRAYEARIQRMTGVDGVDEDGCGLTAASSTRQRRH